MNWFTRYNTVGLLTILLATATGCPPSDPGTANDNDFSTTPTIEAFDASPGAISSGVDVHGDDVQGDVELSWETDDAADISVFANDAPVDLDDCQPLSDENEACVDGGSITAEPLEDTTYRLEVVGHEDVECQLEDGDVQNSSDCASQEVDVSVDDPARMTLERDENRFEPGDEFSVSYEVEHAGEFDLGIAEDGELSEICEVDGSGICSRPDEDSGELHFHDIDEAITVSGTASNDADDDLGNIDVGDVELELFPVGTPVVTSFDADPTHVAFGETSTLHWETEEAAEVEVSSNFEGLIETDLSECTDVDSEGVGSCELTFTDDESEDLPVEFTITAHSDDGEVSSPAETTVILGSAPDITDFDAAPMQLPEQGGDVDLSWTVENEPSHLEIADDDGDIMLDTDDGTGTDACDSSGDDCNLSEDSLTVEDVTENTQFTLTATSPLGSDSSSVNITIEGAPQITSLEVDSQDVTGEPAIVDSSTVDFSWTTEDADDGTHLERGDRPDGGCDSSDVSWSDISDFPGDQSGSYDLDDLDQTEECFQLTAEGDADQSASSTFHVVRHPEVSSFDADPSEATRGDDIELTWDTPFGDDVDVDVDPGAAVSSDDLDECIDVSNGSGSCTVSIRSGAPLGDTEFEIVAHGFDDTVSESATTTVFVGDAPVIDSFSSPATATAGDNVELNWESSEGDHLTIWDGDDIEFESDDSDVIDDGSHTVDDVQGTTTWTLEVDNDFGSDTSDTTTFLGPAIEVFDVNGVDGLDGEVEVDTGDVEFHWEVDASDTQDFERDDIPASGDCSDADDWSILADDVDADGSFTEEDVTENGCYRLVAEDAQGQMSSVTIQVIEVPYVIPPVTTNTSSVPGDTGGTVIVDATVFGADTAEFEARFYDDDDADAPTDTETICTESGLGGDADESDVDCVHEMDGEQCSVLGCNYDPPEDTEYIEYNVTTIDSEGDESSTTTDDGENVDVIW